METSLPSFLPIISISISISFLFISYTASSPMICPPSSCSLTGPEIKFPFRIKNFQRARCGYPGFDLSCNNTNQTILTLPGSGPFLVKKIDYFNQWIYINDPKSCLPKRFLNFTLSGSKFRPGFSRNYTFFNCSAAEWSEYIMPGDVPLFCLGSLNFTVIAIESGGLEKNGSVSAVCRNFSTVTSPVELTAVNPIEDVRLTWRKPSCKYCDAGETCGYVGETGNEVGCFNLLPSSSDRRGKFHFST